MLSYVLAHVFVREANECYEAIALSPLKKHLQSSLKNLFLILR